MLEMDKTFNSPNNYINKRSIYKNKIHKYITVQRIKTKNKKLSIFSEKNKENINNNYFSDINEFNEEIKKHRKIITNANLPFDHIINPLNYNNNMNKKSLLFIYPKELKNSNLNKRSIYNYSQKNIYPKTNKNIDNKDVNIIQHIDSYFTTKAKNKTNIYSNFNKKNNKNKNVKKNILMSNTLE